MATISTTATRASGQFMCWIAPTAARDSDIGQLLPLVQSVVGVHRQRDRLGAGTPPQFGECSREEGSNVPHRLDLLSRAPRTAGVMQRLRALGNDLPRPAHAKRPPPAGTNLGARFSNRSLTSAAMRSCNGSVTWTRSG